MAELRARQDHITHMADRPVKRTRGCKWAEDAVHAIASASLTSQSSQALGSKFWDSEQHRYPWFSTLTARAQQNIFSAESRPDVITAVGQGAEVTIDVPQSLGRQHPVINGTGTILPVGEIWLIRRRRLLSAVEKLRVQKIFPPHHRILQLPAWIGLVHDLAGNAFHTSVRCLLMWFITLVGVCACSLIPQRPHIVVFSV